MRPELLTRLPGPTSCKFYRKFDVNSRLPWRAPTSTLLVGIWRKVCQRVCRQCVPNCILNNNLHSLLSLSLLQSLAIIWQLSYLHKEVNQLRGWSWWPSSVSCVPVLAEQWPVVSLRFGLVLASWRWRPPSTLQTVCSAPVLQWHHRDGGLAGGQPHHRYCPLSSQSTAHFLQRWFPISKEW